MFQPPIFFWIKCSSSWGIQAQISSRKNLKKIEQKESDKWIYYSEYHYEYELIYFPSKFNGNPNTSFKLIVFVIDYYVLLVGISSGYMTDNSSILSGSNPLSSNLYRKRSAPSFSDKSKLIILSLHYVKKVQYD